MPIYEFFSPEKNRIYTFFSHSIVSPDVRPRCPDDPALSLQKMVSGFAVVGRARERTPVQNPDMEEDPRMEAAMAEMEREMAVMDEDNPDPRQMGHLMRRMSEITGEKIPEVMEEMIGRLEAGEDPDQLEEEFGDLSDLEAFGPEEETSEDGEELSLRQKLSRRLKGPDRDPELYELREYI